MPVSLPTSTRTSIQTSCPNRAKVFGMNSNRAGWGAVVLCLMLVGCGNPVTLRSNFPDNQQSHLDQLVGRLPSPSLAREPTNELGQPVVVVAVDGDPSAVAAFNASSGEKLWRSDMAVDSTLVVGGPVVTLKTGESVVGLSVRNGEQLWRYRPGTFDYMGAAIDGNSVYLSFSTASQRASMYREGKTIALDARSGRVSWMLGPVNKQIGAPAASGGVVYVPWDRHSISAFDGESGEELARLLSRDDVYSFVTAGPEGVFYGSSCAYRLTARSASGRRDESSVYEPLVGNTPSKTGFSADGFLGSKGGRDARNKIRFLWRGGPETGDEVRLLDDTLYFLYYRLVFAFDSRTGEVRWARNLERDVEAATVSVGGIVVVDSHGDLISLAADSGEIVHRVSLDVRVAGAAFDIPTLPTGSVEGEPGPSSIRDQLLEIVFDNDTRLTPARRFAVSVLASIPDAEVTRSLLEVCRNRRVPEPIRHDAAMVLRTRQAGSHFLIEALSEHQDYLEQREAPPIGVIAGAVLHMRETSAVNRLVEHLQDPMTPFEDLSPIAAAMTELGDARIVPQLRRFVVRYRADSEFRGREEPLLELVRAIARHGSDADRGAIAELGATSGTLPGLVEGLEAALALPDEAEAGVEGGSSGPTISADLVNDAMQDARDRIRPCIQSALRRHEGLEDVTLNLVITNTGDLEELTVEPQDDVLGSCLTLSLVHSSFPRGDEPRRQVEYTISIRQQPAETDEEE